MLSSRYLHLHEALGLGPMWLNRGAKVLPADTPPAARMPQPAAIAAPATPGPAAAAHPPAAENARLAAVAAVHASAGVSDGQTAAARPSEKSLPAPAANLPEAPAMPADTVGIMPAAVMVVSICPAPEDSAAGQLFSGGAGVLLDNMLAAIGLNPADAHKTSWLKNTSVFTPEPPPDQMAAALPQMQAELAAAQARAVLFLGQVFTQADHAETVAKLCGGTPFFTVAHPARLLRQPQLKKQAWQELKKLRGVLGHS